MVDMKHTHTAIPFGAPCGHRQPRSGQFQRAVGLFLALFCALGVLGAVHPASAEASAVPSILQQADAALPTLPFLERSEGVELVSVLVELVEAPAADAWLAAAAEHGVDAAAYRAPAFEAAQDAKVREAYVAMAAAAQAQLATVAQAQDLMAPMLADLGATEIYRAQRLYNAIAVRIPADKVSALAAIPGVRRVAPLQAKVLDQARSVPWLGIPAIWQGEVVTPLKGEGIRIGVIDTGIDYLHVAFGGPGVGYSQNDTTIVGDVAGYPGRKIVGGYDFVGDDYNANPSSSLYQPIPRPDLDPADCYGHGTHVAGTIGGYGVSSGSTYPGPFSRATPFDTLSIGPGLAPAADLYALKVFGCSGSSEVVDVAIEWAVDPNGDGDFSDRLDVINMSLGSVFGSAEDSTSVAANKAAELGVFVVASAGNRGSVTYSTGSPGSATRVLSVAATRIPDAMSEIFPGSGADVLADFSSLGPRRVDSLMKPDITAPGVAIVSARSGTGSGAVGLDGTSMAAPHVAGAVALLRQYRPELTSNELKAILINTAAPVVRELESYTETLALGSRGGAGRIDLSSALRTDAFAYNSDDKGLVSLSFGAPEVVGTFTDLRNVRVHNIGMTSQTFSLVYLPHGTISDMPGVSVQILHAPTVTVAAGASEGFPVAVSVDAGQLRNGSLPDVDPITSPALLEMEAGMLWFWPTPSVFTADLTASAATARFEGDFNPTTRTLTWSLALENWGSQDFSTLELRRGPAGSAASATAYLLYANGGGSPPASPITGTVVLSAADVPLLAGGYLQVVVTLAEVTNPAAAVLESTVPVLKVPLHIAPRPASAMYAAVKELDFGSSETAVQTLSLGGETLASSGAPTATVALLSPLELHVRSLRTPATQTPPTPAHADIKHVGVTSHFATPGDFSTATLSFAIVTYGPWNTLNEVIFEIFIDTDDDNLADYRLYNGNAGFGSDDRFVTYLQKLSGGDADAVGVVNVMQRGEYSIPIFNSDTLILQVPASALGLSNSRSKVGFIVMSRLRVMDASSTGDATAGSHYDLRRPGLAFSGSFIRHPMLEDTPGDNLVVRLNRLNYVRSTAKGILLIHHHNETGQRSEVVDVRYEWPFNLGLPIIRRN